MVRPRGGQYPRAVREYWRQTKTRQNMEYRTEILGKSHVAADRLQKALSSGAKLREALENELERG